MRLRCTACRCRSFLPILLLAERSHDPLVFSIAHPVGRGRIDRWAGPGWISAACHCTPWPRITRTIFAIATGLVDDELEAVFILDFLTGSLKCAVLSTSTGKFTSAFETLCLTI